VCLLGYRMSGGEGGNPSAHSDAGSERGSTASLPPGPTPPGGGRVVPRSQGGGNVGGAGRGSLFLPPASSVGPGGVHPPAGATTVRIDTVEPPSDANTPFGTRLPYVAGRTDGTSRVAVGESVPRLGDEPAGGSSSRAPGGSLGGIFSVGPELKDAIAEAVRSEIARSLPVTPGLVRSPIARPDP